jgi:rSAM/selenodomain-associated transferase 2
MIDIIIPVLNEEQILTKEARYYQTLKNKARVIFVDGGSADRTVEIARGFGDVVSSDPGRGVQKHSGALRSTSKLLLFLHVDTKIDMRALDRMGQAMKEGAIGGCLTMRIQDDRFIFRVYERIVNFRAKAFGVIDGDLGMFVRRDAFDQLGGFDLLPVMEDITFARKLSKAGPISVLPNTIVVSSRKWQERGFVRTFWEYTIAYLQLWNGSLTAKYNNGHRRPSFPMPPEKVKGVPTISFKRGRNRLE